MAINAYRDQNNRPTMIASSQSDGITIVRILANPTTNNFLKVDDASTGTDNGNHGGVALIDENGISALTALSSTGDGSIIELYADPATGKLLIDSN